MGKPSLVSVEQNDTRGTFSLPKPGRIPRRVPLTCSKCDGPRGPSMRYCNACHAAYMREWRKAHPMNEVQRFKDRARAYANAYKRRGKIAACPCEKCGSARSQMHHENYNDPLDVIWLCRPCHLRLHKAAKVEREREEIAQIVHGSLTQIPGKTLRR